MQREYHRWLSNDLGRDMELLCFGHAGTRVLVLRGIAGHSHLNLFRIARHLSQDRFKVLKNRHLETPRSALVADSGWNVIDNRN